MRMFFLLFLILGLFFSISSFWQGLHNQDLGFNLQKINRENYTYLDEGLDGEIRSPNDLWLLGGKQSLYGFMFTFALSLCIGYYIGYEKKGDSSRISSPNIKQE